MGLAQPKRFRRPSDGKLCRERGKHCLAAGEGEDNGG